MLIYYIHLDIQLGAYLPTNKTICNRKKSILRIKLNQLNKEYVLHYVDK